MSTVPQALPPTVRFSLALSWAFRTMLDRVIPAALFGFVSVSRLPVLVQRVSTPPAMDDAQAILLYRLDLVHQAAAFAFLGLVAVLCLTRKAPLTQRAGLVPLAVSLGGTLMMIFPAMQPRTMDAPWLLALANLLVIGGLVYTLYAVGYLGACFGIAPEARGLVTAGAYGHVRHPVYLGEFIAALGVLLPVVSGVSLVAFGLFVVLQLQRIRMEERVLGTAFADYSEYRRRVPMLIPWPRPVR